MSEFAKFNGKIGPANLLSLVRNTAPFLFERAFTDLLPPVKGKRLIEMGGHPMGWLNILIGAEDLEPAGNPTTEQREDYFALCIACHHATVATFIPTDVDSKIRGHLWQQREDPLALRRMFDLALQWLDWDLSRISTRATAISGVGPVSGHNGEMLGVLAGALGGFLKNGDAEYAEKAAGAIDAELKREAHEFNFVLNLPPWHPKFPPPPPVYPGANGVWSAAPEHEKDGVIDRELHLLRLSSSLTHNVGDLDQGISFWSQREIYQPYRARFHRLAHENTTPYGGTFHLAARLYKNIQSSEGHRHYPLREVRALRSAPDFLLPLGPFFDDWGFLIGSHPKLSPDDRAQALAALLSGCKKIPGQSGYYRAIAGLARALDGKLDDFARRMPASLRQELKNAEVRRHIALKQISFESGMRKRTLAVLSQ